jgi:hypothetical protein
MSHNSALVESTNDDSLIDNFLNEAQLKVNNKAKNKATKEKKKTKSRVPTKSRKRTKSRKAKKSTDSTSNSEIGDTFEALTNIHSNLGQLIDKNSKKTKKNNKPRKRAGKS